MKRVATVLLALVVALSLVACGGKAGPVEDYLSKPEVKAQMDAMSDSLGSSGMQIEISGEGNKLIYAYTFESQLDNLDEVKTALEDAMEAQASVFSSIATTLKTEAKVSEPVVVVRYLNADGSLILEKEYTPN